MEPLSEEKETERLSNAKEFLESYNFKSVGGWFFLKDGVTYDLSAADLTQIERIEREKLFVRV